MWPIDEILNFKGSLKYIFWALGIVKECKGGVNRCLFTT